MTELHSSQIDEFAQRACTMLTRDNCTIAVSGSGRNLSKIFHRLFKCTVVEKKSISFSPAIRFRVPSARFVASTKRSVQQSHLLQIPRQHPSVLSRLTYEASCEPALPPARRKKVNYGKTRTSHAVLHKQASSGIGSPTDLGYVAQLKHDSPQVEVHAEYAVPRYLRGASGGNA